MFIEQLNASLGKLLIPGSIPERGVFAVSLLFIVLIAVADMMSGPSIRLFYLYTFPFAAIGLHTQKILFRFIVVSSALIGELTVQIILHYPVVPVLMHLPFKAAASVLIVTLASSGRKLYLQTMEMAATDTLTGLLNRREFERLLNLEIERKKRHEDAFAVLMLDLDGFKRLNDTQGHKAGDDALRLVGVVLKQSIRKSDSTARLGGDEFAILMPYTSLQDCRDASQHLCAVLAQDMETHGFFLTVSIGAIAFKTPPSSAEQALTEADRVMYQAKQSGKNQAVCAEF